MRRIALVCDWYHPRRGGIEAHLDGLATRLAARGDDVRVITSTPGPAEVNGIPVHRLEVPLVPFANVAGAPVSALIQRLVERHRVELVHSHVSIVAPVGLGGALAAHRAGLASVVTFHSFVPATPLLARAVGWLFGAARWRAQMTAVSNRVAREVESFAPGARFELLPNAIDTGFWSPAAVEANDDVVRLVYAGRLQPKKRPMVLLRVLRELEEQVLRGVHPEERSDERTQDDRPRWHLHIAGTGDLEAPLRRAVNAAGFADRVTFTGWMNSVQLRDLLRSSHVFLSTAARESFGLAALEARAVGLPVIAVRDSAVADFIAHEQSGLLADDDDDFARSVARLVGDETLRRRVTAFNRATRVPFDWDHSLSRHEQVYRAAEARLLGGQ
jgi:glycosyltransferase involved in cell wall biosynthesis